MRHLRLCACAFALAALGACGDNLSPALPDAAAPDAAVPDAALPDGSPGTPDAGVVARGFAVAGDFMGTGVATSIAPADLSVSQNVAAGIASGDPVVRYHDGRLLIVNRFGADNVTVIDADDYSLIAQISTGAGSNPQDVAVKGDTLYVAALSASGVLVLDLAQPSEGVQETIDLASLDDDGVPDCHSLQLVGDELYVSCGRLENFAPTGPGAIAVIDTTSNSVVDDFDLTTENPVGFLQAAPAGSALAGDLLVATVDFGDLASGCVERIATAEPRAATCLIGNQELGGYAIDFAVGDDDELYLAVVSGFDGGVQAALTSYDLVADSLRDEPLSPAEQSIVDIAWCPDGLLLSADASAGGLRIYDSAGGERTNAALDIGLPPVNNGLVCY